MSDIDLTMSYYNPSLLDYDSKEASLICQLVADKVRACGYPMCNKEVVGCAVHETIIKTKAGYKDGIQFLPVCKRHKAWELEKVSGVEAWGLA